MPQEFQVLRCFKCETFQVSQVKKSPKWVCKICQEKQTTKHVYCRLGISVIAFDVKIISCILSVALGLSVGRLCRTLTGRGWN